MPDEKLYPASNTGDITANPRGEGVYRMLAPDRKSWVSVPYSNVPAARRELREFVDEAEGGRFQHDFGYATEPEGFVHDAKGAWGWANTTFPSVEKRIQQRETEVGLRGAPSLQEAEYWEKHPWLARGKMFFDGLAADAARMAASPMGAASALGGVELKGAGAVPALVRYVPALERAAPALKAASAVGRNGLRGTSAIYGAQAAYEATTQGILPHAGESWDRYVPRLAGYGAAVMGAAEPLSHVARPFAPYAEGPLTSTGGFFSRQHGGLYGTWWEPKRNTLRMPISLSRSSITSGSLAVWVRFPKRREPRRRDCWAEWRVQSMTPPSQA